MSAQKKKKTKLNCGGNINGGRNEANQKHTFWNQKTPGMRAIYLFQIFQ